MSFGLLRWELGEAWQSHCFWWGKRAEGEIKATDTFKHSQYQIYLKQLLSDLKKFQNRKSRLGGGGKTILHSQQRSQLHQKQKDRTFFLRAADQGSHLPDILAKSYHWFCKSWVMKFLLSSKECKTRGGAHAPWRWFWPPTQLTESLEDPTEFCGPRPYLGWK